MRHAASAPFPPSLGTPLTSVSASVTHVPGCTLDVGSETNERSVSHRVTVAPRVGAITDAAGHALLRGMLEERLFLGSVYRHYVRVEGETLMVDGVEPVDPGPVTVRVPVGRLQIYAAP